MQRGPVDDTRVSHNSELLGGVCPGSWKETSRWVLALRNSDVVFKKRPLMCAKKRAEWEQQRRAQLFSNVTGAAASVSVGGAAADAGSAPAAAAPAAGS